MAWTDACKIEAVAQIDKRKEAQGGVKPAIRDLSKESGIPERTLERWYWPDKKISAKTGATEKTPQGIKEFARIVCKHLENNPDFVSCLAEMGNELVDLANQANDVLTVKLVFGFLENARKSIKGDEKK